VTNAERQDRLEQAEALVREVALDLNSNTTECEGCHAERYAHYGEYRAFLELDGVAQKLGKLAGQIGAGLPAAKAARGRGGF